MRWICAFIFGTITVIPFAYLAYLYSGIDFYHKTPYEATIEYVNGAENSPIEAGGEFSIRSCCVIDGFRFAILLENNKWINARLNVVTKTDATKKVIEILGLSPSPVVVLKRKIDDYWIIDIRLTLDTKVVMLGDLLRELNLAL